MYGWGNTFLGNKQLYHAVICSLTTCIFDKELQVRDGYCCISHFKTNAQEDLTFYGKRYACLANLANSYGFGSVVQAQVLYNNKEGSSVKGCKFLSILSAKQSVDTKEM